MYMTEGEICAMYRQAANPKAQIAVLAQLNGVPKETIEAILIRHGYDPEKRGAIMEGADRSGGRGMHTHNRVFTDEEKQTVIRMRTERRSQKDIAIVLGCCESRVRRLLREMNMNTKMTKGRKPWNMWKKESP